MVGKGCILKVDHRLRNSPAAQPDTATLIFAEFGIPVQ
ncbi:MAG: hypothetical protein HW390_2768 [Candidatus Brocadiaceae bacterium]|nr:hypothetical protein [Candidatus Brocadiaceae bacterium]